MVRLQDIFTVNLKKHRRLCGLTQAELAEKVNVSTHHIGMIELSRNYPTLELVERIANALGIEFHELFKNPRSPDNEFDRLRQEIRGDMKQLLEEFLEKSLSGKCREGKKEIRIKDTPSDNRVKGKSGNSRK